LILGNLNMRPSEAHDALGRILVIEDDPVVAQTVASALGAEGFSVNQAATLSDGRAAAGTKNYEAIILDLTLPDGSGLDLAESLRGEGSDVPILMLTAHNTVVERVEGFRHGADDYVGKPFAVDELIARLHALLRRAGQRGQHVLRYADVELDLLKRCVRRGETEAELSAREMGLLALLLRHAEQVVSRPTIIDEIWGGHGDEEDNALNVYINYLRNKLERGRYPRLIHTVRGTGYLLSRTPPPEAL